MISSTVFDFFEPWFWRSFLSGKDESKILKKEQKRLTEKDVGITEYLSSHDGFTGILKQRWCYENKVLLYVYETANYTNSNLIEHGNDEQSWENLIVGKYPKIKIK